jgi:hypothetical protein
MRKQYYLADNGTHQGPYEFETVLKKLESQEKQWTDYVFDESVGDWLMLLEHPEFATMFGQSLNQTPKHPIKAPVKDFMKERVWFIMKDEKNFGPFSQLEIIQMLQEKALFEGDLVWKNLMTTWRPIAEVADFSPEAIRRIKDSGEPITEVFYRRRHMRANYDASLLVHDHKMVFRGQAVEISAGGAGVLIEQSSLVPGQSLFLHFQKGDGVPPFNAVCQIVSKQAGVVVAPDSPEFLKYGVKFTTLSQSVRDSIKNYTSTRAA